MSELFPAEQVSKDSPRLAWIKSHNVQTIHNSDVQLGEECPESGETLYPWCASIGRFNGANGHFGNSEDEAITALAIAKGIRLWNETPLK